LLLVLTYAVQGPIRSWLSGRHRAVATFDRALGLIVDEYVEPIEPKEVLPGAIQGMINALKKDHKDRHSDFLAPAANQRLEDAERGKFAGVGIYLRLIQGRLTIHKVMAHSPAVASGLEPGDIILAADHHDLTKIKTRREAVKVITGPVGTNVTLSILRGNQRLRVTLTRRKFPKTIVEHRRISDLIGYIRIAEFPDDVSDKVRDAIKDLRTAPPVRALLLDLRDNEGGFLDEAVRVADLFVADGLIVSTKCRRPSEDRSHHASPGGPAEDLPIIVLVDGRTASAAEVVAGALQDHRRARLLGTKTFGKGAVNKRFPLADGSGILLTTGKYFLPKGRQIEGKGILPDIEVKPATKEQIENTPAGAEFPDPQLDAAVKLLTRELTPAAAPKAP
jgi:carboxyl-terminal processing protease